MYVALFLYYHLYIFEAMQDIRTFCNNMWTLIKDASCPGCLVNYENLHKYNIDTTYAAGLQGLLVLPKTSLTFARVISVYDILTSTCLSSKIDSVYP